MNDVVRIPLRSRGGFIRDHVVVDANDAKWANQWRWSLSGDGYAKRTATVDGKQRTVLLHREILGLPRATDGREGDHIDRNRLNCRRSNLRVLPEGANDQNRASNRRATSSYRGVSLETCSGKWKAQVQVNGKTISLGRFSDEHAAAEAARAGRLRLMSYAID